MENFKHLHFLIMSLLVAFVCVSCAHSQKHKAGHHKGYDKHLWKKMDTNKDHQISHEEYTNAHNRKFKKIDTDGDNNISKEEKKAWKKKMKHKKKASKHSDKHASCDRKDKKRYDCKKWKKHKKHKWKKMDTNQDGQVSHEEFINAMNKKFEKMDTDGDKMVSKEEKKAWKKKKKKKMKEWHKKEHKKDSDREAATDQPEEKDDTVAEAKPAEGAEDNANTGE